MRTAIFLGTLFLLIMSCPSWLLAGQAASTASHCTDNESIIFTGPVAGKKVLSVCASQEYGPDAGYLQYRYGSIGKVELSLPKKQLTPSKSAKSGMWTFSGGGGAYLQFVNGNTSYYVYSAIGKWGPEGETVEKAGVAVERGGKIVQNILCQGPETSELGPDFFEKAGLPELETEFELPE